MPGPSVYVVGTGYSPCSSSQISTCMPEGPRDTAGLPRTHWLPAALCGWPPHRWLSSRGPPEGTPWNSHIRKRRGLRWSCHRSRGSRPEQPRLLWCQAAGYRRCRLACWWLDRGPGADVQHQDDVVIGDGQVPLILTKGHAVDGFPGFWRRDAHHILPGIQGEHQDDPWNEAGEKEIGLLSDLQTPDFIRGVQGILLLACHGKKTASRTDHRDAGSEF